MFAYMIRTYLTFCPLLARLHFTGPEVSQARWTDNLRAEP